MQRAGCDVTTTCLVARVRKGAQSRSALSLLLPKAMPLRSFLGAALPLLVGGLLLGCGDKTYEVRIDAALAAAPVGDQ
jgi:hypothetical protein